MHRSNTSCELDTHRMAPATSSSLLQESWPQLACAADSGQNQVTDDFLNHFAFQQDVCDCEHMAFSFDTGGLPSEDSFQHASQDQAALVWNPTPSVPDFLRSDVTLSLARDLYSAVPADQSHEFGQASGNSNISGTKYVAKQISGPDKSNSSLHERKLAINRQAQQRFRARRKAIFCASRWNC